MKTSKANWLLKQFLIYFALCIVSIPFALPLIWMILTSLKPFEQTLKFPPEWLPNPVMWSNYQASLVDVVPLNRYFINTIFYSSISTIGTIISSSICAFAFAKLRAPGRRPMFLLMLSTLLLPFPSLMIPQFLLFNEFGWIDTYFPLIVPSFFGSAFIIFLLRQFIQSIPSEIIDAAYLDGANPLTAFFLVVLPLSTKGILVASVLVFSSKWNDYLTPLIFINSQENFTLQLGLASFIAHRGISRWELLMAASTLAMAPVVTVFFVAQHFLKNELVFSGVK